VVHSTFYWLAVPKDAAKAGQEIIASIDGQGIEVSAREIATVIVRLNDAMANLDEPITIRSGGKVLFQGKVKRTIATLSQTLANRGDRDLMFSAEVTVTP